MLKVEEREFDLLGDLDNEEDIITEIYEYSTGYVADVISEIADGAVPIYTSDLWKNAYDIQEHIEEAIAQGLVVVEGNDIDLTRIFSAGYYQYYTQSLYNNLDTLAFNMVAKLVNEKLNSLDEDIVSNLNIEDIESAIEDKTEYFDNNNEMSTIEDLANEVIEEYIEENEED